MGPDDLPDEIRRLLRAAEAIDAAAVDLRLLVHTAPDRDWTAPSSTWNAAAASSPSCSANFCTRSSRS